MDAVQAINFSVELLQALLWQYNDAESLQSLLEQKQAWYDINQSEFWDDWLVDVFDLRTANDFGLAVWGILLDSQLFVITPASLDKPIFGFGNNGSFSTGFSDGFDIGAGPPYFYTNFFNATFGRKTPGVIGLTLAQRRLILRLRYFNLTTRPSVPQINAFLADIFKAEGTVYVLDVLNMTAKYIFTYKPSVSLQYVFDNFDILPRPAGVKTEVDVITRKVFGFGQYHANFYQSNFGASHG